MIASFAFNFNNFGNIYLLTGGGPYTRHVVGRGLDGHPDQLHVQARDRDRQGHGLRPRERGRDHHLLHRGVDLRRLLLPVKSLENLSMSSRRARRSTPDVAAAGARRRARARRRRPKLQGQLVAAPRRRSIAIVVALFPVVFVISSAFNRDNTLQGASADPDARDAAQLRQPAAQQRRDERAAATPTRPTSAGSSTR